MTLKLRTRIIVILVIKLRTRIIVILVIKIRKRVTSLVRMLCHITMKLGRIIASIIAILYRKVVC